MNKEVTFTVKLMADGNERFSGGFVLEDLTNMIKAGSAVGLSCRKTSERTLENEEARSILLDLSFDPDSLPFGL